MTLDEYTPLPWQSEFHLSDAKERWLLGDYGSGKTLAGCVEAVKTALLYPGSWGLVGRYFTRDLQGLRDTIRELAPPDSFAGPDLVRFPNGSYIVFRHLKDPDLLRGYVLDWFFLDEIGEIPDDTAYEMAKSRTRRVRGPRRGWVAGGNFEDVDLQTSGWTGKICSRGGIEVFRPPEADNPYFTAKLQGAVASFKAALAEV